MSESDILESLMNKGRSRNQSWILTGFGALYSLDSGATISIEQQGTRYHIAAYRSHGHFAVLFEADTEQEIRVKFDWLKSILIEEQV